MWRPSEDVIAAVAAVEEQAATRVIPCAGGRIAWRTWPRTGPDDGDGPRLPLVLFPGGFGSWRHWFANLERLRRRFTVHCVEPPGLGDSDPPCSSPPDLDELAGSVIDAFDVALGTDGAAHLVGFSFGGIIAGRAAVRLGARAASLTLSGSGALGLPRPRLPAAMPVTPDLSPARLRAALEHNLAGFMLGPGRIDELALYLELESVRRSRLNYVPILRSSALLESLQIAECALAGIWGANDPFAGGGVEGYRECFDRLRPGGRFEVVEGASHWVMYDRPEAYCASLESILDGYRR